MMHWQGLTAIVTIICTTFLIIQDKPWWGIGLLLLILFAISPKEK